MRKLILLLSIITNIGLSACNKDKNERNGLAQIRIINKSALPLSNAVIGSEMFGSIAPFQTSGYHNIKNVYYGPILSLYNDKTLVQLGIGYCGTPPLPENSYLKGKFTYTIVQDSTNSLGFGFTFTED